MNVGQKRMGVERELGPRVESIVHSWSTYLFAFSLEARLSAFQQKQFHAPAPHPPKSSLILESSLNYSFPFLLPLLCITDSFDGTGDFIIAFSLQKALQYVGMKSTLEIYVITVALEVNPG